MAQKTKIIPVLNGMSQPQAPSAKSVAKYGLLRMTAREINNVAKQEGEGIKYCADLMRAANPTTSIPQVEFPVIMEPSGKIRAVTTVQIDPSQELVSGEVLGKLVSIECNRGPVTLPAKKYTILSVHFPRVSRDYIQKVMEAPAEQKSRKSSAFSRCVKKAVVRGEKKFKRGIAYRLRHSEVK